MGALQTEQVELIISHSLQHYLWQIWLQLSFIIRSSSLNYYWQMIHIESAYNAPLYLLTGIFYIYFFFMPLSIFFRLGNTDSDSNSSTQLLRFILLIPFRFFCESHFMKISFVLFLLQFFSCQSSDIIWICWEQCWHYILDAGQIELWVASYSTHNYLLQRGQLIASISLFSYRYSFTIFLYNDFCLGFSANASNLALLIQASQLVSYFSSVQLLQCQMQISPLMTCLQT